jgi:hypothetical protein
MPRLVLSTTPFIACLPGKRVARLVALLGLALMLGACSKCDVPDWFHTSPAPHACHDGAPAQ